ncbi:MAG: hypothetical protein ACFE9Q_12085 [Candidatus Hodarchaeota archaeon]
MIANKSILTIGLMIIFGFSTIISIPIILITIGFSPYITVDYKDYQEFIFNSSTVIDLKLEIDVGNVDIKYTYDPVDYHARVDLNIEMIGQNIPSNNYNDYFNIENDSTSNSLTLTMELIAENDFNEMIWKEKDIEVILTLNPTILFNIDTSIMKEGDISLLVEGEATINNLEAYSKKGNIFFDFKYCSIGGDITGIVNKGYIELSLYNVNYTKNSIWNLTNNYFFTPEDLASNGAASNGNILIDIKQDTAIRFNITGTAIVQTENIYASYTDNTPDVEAAFTFHGMGNVPEDAVFEGFTSYPEINEKEYWQARVICISDNFPGIGNYNISFYRTYIYSGSSYFIKFTNG